MNEMREPFFNLDPIEPSSAAARYDRERLRLALHGAMTLVAGIWLVWLCGALLGWPLDDLGIRPRQLSGLVGILSAPLVHGSLAHLVSNTLPLVVLGSLTLYSYPRAFRYALPLIWIGAGCGVWLFARPYAHIGISGIIHGLMFFLFFMGLLRRDRQAISMALIVFFLYGGMVLTILPRELEISWEYHLFGALFGVMAAILLRRFEPLPPRKLYSWDHEPDALLPDAEFEPRQSITYSDFISDSSHQVIAIRDGISRNPESDEPTRH